MAELPISTNHKPAIARMQHVLEWLSGERARLEAELVHVVTAGQRENDRLVMFLQQQYGVDASHVAVTVDVERGVITTPDPEETPTAEPTAELAALGDEPTAEAPAPVPMRANRASRRARKP